MRVPVSGVRFPLLRVMHRAAVCLCAAYITLATAAPASGELKPACRGLMIREFQGRDLLPFMDSAVVHVLWKELETRAGAFDGPGWQKIETARKIPGIRLRLRIMCGVHAPDFVKQLCGPGVSDPANGIDCSRTGGIAIFNPHDRRGGSIPRFWLPEVLDRYEKLMTEVARRYEDAPQICEVVASGAMTLYAEPFYRAHRDAGSNERLFRAGLNFETDRAAHERVIRIHDRLFRKTRTSLAVNAWDIIDKSPPHVRSEFRPVFEFATWARQLMGARLVLQNNGTGPDARCPGNGPPHSHQYCFLASAAGPKGFQTRTLQRLGGPEGLLTTLEAALKMGANFVELPSGFSAVDEARLAACDARLRGTHLP